MCNTKRHNMKMKQAEMAREMLQQRVSPGCSCIEHRFNSHHPHGNSQLSGDSDVLLNLQGKQNAPL